MLLAIAVGGALAVLIRGTPGEMASAARARSQTDKKTRTAKGDFGASGADTTRAQEATRAGTTRTTSTTRSSTTKSTKTKSTRTKSTRTKAAKAKHAPRRSSPDPDPYLSMPGDADDTPAHRYGQLSQVECEAELVARHVAFIRETAPSVLAPVRLTGPVRGVLFRSNAKDRVRATSPYEIVDCRLVLALTDFAQILNRHGIVEVRHYSMYRPPRTELERERGTRHPAALAIDTGLFIDRAGAVLDVDRDFHGAIDAATCGEGAAPDPATAEALALRAILCETASARLFNVVLTPNYNRAHQNHFHLEITPGVRWFLLH